MTTLGRLMLQGISLLKKAAHEMNPKDLEKFVAKVVAYERPAIKIASPLDEALKNNRFIKEEAGGGTAVYRLGCTKVTYPSEQVVVGIDLVRYPTKQIEEPETVNALKQLKEAPNRKKELKSIFKQEKKRLKAESRAIQENSQLNASQAEESLAGLKAQRRAAEKAFKDGGKELKQTQALSRQKRRVLNAQAKHFRFTKFAPVEGVAPHGTTRLSYNDPKTEIQRLFLTDPSAKDMEFITAALNKEKQELIISHSGGKTFTLTPQHLTPNGAPLPEGITLEQLPHVGLAVDDDLDDFLLKADAFKLFREC